MTKPVKAMIYVATKKSRVLGVFSNQAKAIAFAGDNEAEIEMWDAQQSQRMAVIKPERA